MADTPKLVSSMGRAELDRIFVRGYDLNRELLGKINSRPWVSLRVMSKSFAILGRALGGLAHVGEEIRRPIARGEPEK